MAVPSSRVADILALTDRLAIQETAQRASADSFDQHAKTDPHIRDMAQERARRADDLHAAIALLTAFAQIVRVVEEQFAGAVSRRQLRGLLERGFIQDGGRKI